MSSPSTKRRVRRQKMSTRRRASVPFHKKRYVEKMGEVGHCEIGSTELAAEERDEPEQ
jgi:hypothetical protein